jgi:hypothetical protein
VTLTESDMRTHRTGRLAALVAAALAAAALAADTTRAVAQAANLEIVPRVGVSTALGALTDDAELRTALAFGVAAELVLPVLPFGLRVTVDQISNAEIRSVMRPRPGSARSTSRRSSATLSSDRCPSCSPPGRSCSRVQASATTTSTSSLARASTCSSPRSGASLRTSAAVSTCGSGRSSSSRKSPTTSVRS